MHTCKYPHKYNALKAAKSNRRWQQDLVQAERKLAKEIPKVDANPHNPSPPEESQPTIFVGKHTNCQYEESQPLCQTISC